MDGHDTIVYRSNCTGTKKKKKWMGAFSDTPKVVSFPLDRRNTNLLKTKKLNTNFFVGVN